MKRTSLPISADAAPPAVRNPGIDLLRILAGFYIIVLHSLGQGGLLQTAAEGGSQYMFSWAMEAFAFCAVDIFALISGYVSYSDRPKKFKISGYLMLWLRVVVYGVGIMLIGKLILPQSVVRRDVFKMIFPVSNGLYWYFSAYTALFFSLPFLNAGIRACPEKTLRKIFIVIFVLFSVYDNTARRFHLENGYSFIWLALLYIMGAAVKKCGLGKSLHPAVSVAGIVVLGALGWLWKLFGLDFRFFNVSFSRAMFISYTSPTVLGAALLYLILFSKIRVGHAAGKAISFAAPGAFSAYILNCHPFIWQNLMYMRFADLASGPLPPIFLSVSAFSLIFLAASVTADKILTGLFALLGVRRLADRISAGAAAAAERLAGRLP